MRECAGILLPAFCFFSFLLLTRNAPSQYQLKFAFGEAFSSSTINCSSFCKNRRHRRDSAFRRAWEADAEKFLSSGKPSGKGQWGEKAKRKQKTKTKKKSVSGILSVTLFSLPWTEVFFFPFLKKEGQRERNTSAFFLFFCGQRKKKKEKKEGDNLHPGKEKEKSGSTP